MKIIITGSTGMIGLALIELLHKENEIYAIIRPDSTRKSLLEEYVNIHIIECDLNNLNSVKDTVDSADIFFHLGWSGTTGNDRNNIKLQTKNVEYTLDAIKLAEDLNCKSFVGAGSQAEYGIKEDKLTESTKTDPVTAYGIAKRAAGQLGKILSENYDLKFCWTRILSVYGPGFNNTMINACIESFLNDEEFDTTEGKQQWDYIYSEDCAGALYSVALNGRDSDTYVIGSGKTRTISEYITIIKDVVNSGSKINFGAIPYRENQIMYLCADITKLKDDTGFELKTTFEEGIEKTVKWYKKNYKLKSEKEKGELI